MPSLQFFPQEIWKTVLQSCDLYEVSNYGRVRSVSRRVQRYNHQAGRKVWSNVRGRLLKPWKSSPSGHLSVSLSLGGKVYSRRIHQLVLEAFVGPCPPGLECRHLDDCPTNNRLSNLKWGTHQENMRDKIRLGTILRGESNGASRLSEKIVAEIRKKRKQGLSQKEIGHEFGVGQSTVSRILTGVRWRHSLKREIV